VKPHDCEFLVVGAGSTGLALVDHLLRRDVGSVTLLDTLNSPQAGPTGTRVPLLAPSGPQWDPCVRRSRELYEGWSDWIEIDPELRRCGALLPEANGLLPLQGTDSARRWSSLQPDGPICMHDPAAATVDSISVASALLWRIRKAGGNFFPTTCLSSLVETSDGVHFTAGVREGTASHVFLCVGSESLDWLDRLGVRHQFVHENVSTFTIQLSDDLPPIIYWGEEKALLFDRGDGLHDLQLIDSFEESAGSLPSVDWNRCANFRAKWKDWIPQLADTETLRASARKQISCMDAPSTIASAGGRIVFPGACGEFSPLLFPALAEMTVESHLAGTTGGLLEDLG
jgi:glycine/D-amino acid oxidase-like deaminating enzyme